MGVRQTGTTHEEHTMRAMTDTDLTDYLGDTPATTEQRHRMLDASAEIDARYPHEDEETDRCDAFAAAVADILEDTQGADYDPEAAGMVAMRVAMAIPGARWATRGMSTWHMTRVYVDDREITVHLSGAPGGPVGTIAVVSTGGHEDVITGPVTTATVGRLVDEILAGVERARGVR